MFFKKRCTNISFSKIWSSLSMFPGEEHLGHRVALF